MAKEKEIESVENVIVEKKDENVFDYEQLCNIKAYDAIKRTVMAKKYGANTLLTIEDWDKKLKEDKIINNK